MEKRGGSNRKQGAPDVSVIIPVLNSSVPLRCCLEALGKQVTSRSFEVVVVDDGSQEDLSALRQEFSHCLDLRWERLAVNRGPASARNRGIAIATGEIILFTDADCRPGSDWVECLSAPFCDPNVSGAKGIYRTDQRGVWARLSQLEFEERYQLLQSCTDLDFVDTYCGAFRRADLLAVGGFDEQFRRADNEDVDLSFRVKKRGGRFVFVPAAIVHHRHRDSLSAYARLKFGRGYWRMRVYRKHPDKAGRDSYTPWTLKAQMLLLLLFPLAICTRRNFGRWVAVWFLTCGPQIKLAWKFDPGLSFLIPFFHFIRDLALLAGIVAEAKEFHANPVPLPDAGETVPGM